MKNLYKNILKVSLGLLTLFLINSCDDEETSFALNNISAPSDLVANIVISADDANTLSVTPAATGVSVFQIYFGDIENEEATIISLGETAEHTYEDGEYLLRVIAQGITGLTSEFNSIVSVGEEMVITPVDPVLPIEPQIAAPIPTQAEADVISLFSDTYADVTVDTWRTDWSETMFEDVTLADNPVKKYSELNFVGIETVANQIDATNMTHLHIDVWSADFTEFKVKLVDFGADGAFDAGDVDDVEHELTFETPTQGEWISLDIPLSDFEGLTTRANIAQYIFVASPSSATTVFIDNLYFYKTASTDVTLPSFPIDLESTELIYEWIGFGSDSFGSIPSTVVNNPDVSGINTSGNVLEIEKLPGAQVWAGASLALSGPIDFTQGTTISIKVWSPRVGTPILFKTEDVNSVPDANGNPSVFAEVQAITTVANAWEELFFDMTLFADFSTSISYHNTIIFPDFGNVGTGDKFYFDDIKHAELENELLELPIDLESTELIYEWVGFGSDSFGSIPAVVVDNPDSSGINTSNSVLEIEKLPGAQVWAGASLALSGPIDFTQGTTISIKVWSPRIGVPILFKTEDVNSAPDANGNPSVFVEVEAITTVSNAWEELSFDLTSIGSFSTSILYSNTIIFPDFGNIGTGEKFYFDDIKLN